MNHPADPLISAWLIGQIDADGMRALEEFLRTDAAARVRFAAFCHSEVVLPQAARLAPMRPGTTGVRRAVSKRIHVRPRTVRSRFPWMLPIAVAALVAVVVLVVTSTRPSLTRPVLDQNALLAGPLVVERTDGSVYGGGALLTPGMSVARGMDLNVRGGNAVLRWQPDGSQLIATPDTVLRVDGGGAAVQLVSGQVEAVISKQSSTPFVIRSPHATTSVMGTRFVLRVQGGGTDLVVEEGRVRFAASSDGTTQEVIAQERARADANGLQVTDQGRVRGVVPTSRDVTRSLGPPMMGRGTLSLATLPKDGINLRVDCDSAVKSLRISMPGVEQRLEEVVHFHVFGDTANRASNPWKPHLGVYSIKLQPYAEHDGRAPLGPQVVFELTIVP